jgi:hypothetical protein
MRGARPRGVRTAKLVLHLAQGWGPPMMPMLLFYEMPV